MRTLDVRNIRVDMPEPPREPRLFSWFDRYSWLNYGHFAGTADPADTTASATSSNGGQKK